MFGCSFARQFEESRRKRGLWVARDVCCRNSRLCPWRFRYQSPRPNTWTAVRGGAAISELIWGPLVESSSTFRR